ncbi:MAG TPA: ArsA-related P-loop ATPase [Jiangellaceae bacterium]|nr:ArsA-related P-loop ATPase [Jiangellaceae bacterium]
MSDWEGVRLHVITGKGGTGKTTVAAALALALASGGHQVLLVEVEERQGLAQLFDVAPLPYEERKLALGRDGGDVFGLAVEARQAMYEYLDMYYRLGRAGRALDRMGIVEFATTVAPGMRDVLLTGKTYEATRRRRRDGGFVYDAVVLDAPPTGRISRFLSVGEAVTSLARVGPISRHATAITALISSPRTAVHVVTVLEEMPVQETVDAVADLDDAGIPVGAVVVNQVRRPLLRARDLAAAHRGTLDRAAIEAGLRAAGLARDRLVDHLTTEAAAHADRVALEKRARATVGTLDRPTYELPWLPDGVDLAGLYEMAAALTDQGAA